MQKKPQPPTLRQLLASAAARAGVRLSAVYELIALQVPIPDETLKQLRTALEQMGWSRDRFYFN